MQVFQAKGLNYNYETLCNFETFWNLREWSSIIAVWKETRAQFLLFHSAAAFLMPFSYDLSKKKISIDMCNRRKCLF